MVLVAVVATAGFLHVSPTALVVAAEAQTAVTALSASCYATYKTYKHCLKPVTLVCYNTVKKGCLFFRSTCHDWRLQRNERLAKNATLRNDLEGLSTSHSTTSLAIRNKMWQDVLKTTPEFCCEIINGVMPAFNKQGLGLHGERYVTQNGVPYKIVPVSSSDGKVKYDIIPYPTVVHGEVAMSHWLPKIKVSAREAPKHGVALGMLRNGYLDNDSASLNFGVCDREFAAQGFFMSSLTKDSKGNNHLLCVTNAHVALAIGSNLGTMSSIVSSKPGVWHSASVVWHYPFAGSEKNLRKLGGTVDDIAVCIVPHNWASDLGVTPLKASMLSFEQSGPITFYTHNDKGTFAHSGTFVDGGNGIDGVLTHNCSTGHGDSSALGYHSSKVAASHFGGLPGHYNLAINAATILQLMRLVHVVPTPTFEVEVKASEAESRRHFVEEVKDHANKGIVSVAIDAIYGNESNTKRGKQNARNQRTLFDRNVFYANDEADQQEAYLQHSLDQLADHTGNEQGTLNKKLLTKRGQKSVAAWGRFKNEVACGSGGAGAPPGLYTTRLLDPNDNSTNPTPFEDLDFVGVRTECVADPFQDVYSGPKVTIPIDEGIEVQEHVAVFLEPGFVAVQPNATIAESVEAVLAQPDLVAHILDAYPSPIGKPIHLEALKTGAVHWDRGVRGSGESLEEYSEVSGKPTPPPPSGAPSVRVDDNIPAAMQKCLNKNDLEGALYLAKDLTVEQWESTHYHRELMVHAAYTGFKDTSSSIGALPDDEGDLMEDIKDESGRCVFKLVGRCTKQGTGKVPNGMNKKGEKENLKGKHLSQAFCNVVNANRPGVTPMRPTSYYLPPENDEAVFSSLKTQAKRVGKGNLDSFDSETLDYAFDKMLGSSAKVHIENTMHTTFTNWLDTTDGEKSAGWSSVVLDGPKGVWKRHPDKLWRLTCLRAIALLVNRGELPTMTPLEKVKKGLMDPHVLSTKVEGHSEEKAEGGRWRNIWISSMLDLAVQAVVDIPLNKEDVKAYQRGDVNSHTTNAVGIGHDERGVRRLTQALEHMCSNSDGTLTSEDASGWDMSVTIDDFLVAADLRVCSTYCSDPKVAFVTKELIYALAYCKAKHCIAIAGNLYEVQFYGIMPSGMLSTSCDNGKIRGFLSYACGAESALAAGDDLVATGAKNEALFNSAGKNTREGAKTVKMFSGGVIEFNSHLLSISSFNNETRCAVWNFTRSEGSFSKILANCFLKAPKGISQATANGVYSTLQGSPQATVFAQICADMKWPHPVDDKTTYSDWDVLTECITRR